MSRYRRGPLGDRQVSLWSFIDSLKQSEKDLVTTGKQTFQQMRVHLTQAGTSIVLSFAGMQASPQAGESGRDSSKVCTTMFFIKQVINR